MIDAAASEFSASSSSCYNQLQSPEEVIRSVFEQGASERMSNYELSNVLSAVKRMFTRDENPVQEECITSSCHSPSGVSDRLPTAFWFLLSNKGSLEHVSEASIHLLNIPSNELIRRSVFSLICVKDHHMIPPILHSGPSTSMSCRLHIKSPIADIPFDVTFAKLSTRQISLDPYQNGYTMVEIVYSSEILSKLQGKNHEDIDWTLTLHRKTKPKRSATLCVARSVVVSHGIIIINIDTNYFIQNIQNKSSLPIDESDLCGIEVRHIFSKNDHLVLDTLLQSQSECSADLQIILREVSALTTVRRINSNGEIRLQCHINRISCSPSTISPILPHDPTTSTNPTFQLPSQTQQSIDDPLSQICYSIFSQPPDINTINNNNINNNNNYDPEMQYTLSIHPPSYDDQTNKKDEKIKKPRKTRAKKVKPSPQPVKNAVLKSILGSQRQSYEYDQNTEHNIMYQAVPPMYQHNSVNPIMYQTPMQQCSSYMPPNAICQSDYSIAQSQQMVLNGNGTWQQNSEYYHPQQATFPQVQKNLKRKPSSTTERPNKMPYGTNPPPAFTFQQSGPILEGGGISPMCPSDEYHLPTGNHLSPYRYSPSPSQYWPPSVRPPSRSEFVRMELRNSLHAKQAAATNQQRLQAASLASEAQSHQQNRSSAPSNFTDNLFDSDFGLKDSDGSLDAELDSVYDFNLGGGCGFDMENDATRCLVMKLLS